MGKNVTLFSYMVMQHTAHLENLSSYTGTVYANARRREYRLYGIVGVTEPGLPEHPGWIANRRRVFPFTRDIFARVAYELQLPHGTTVREVEFTSI